MRFINIYKYNIGIQEYIPSETKNIKNVWDLYILSQTRIYKVYIIRDQNIQNIWDIYHQRPEYIEYMEYISSETRI